VTHKIGLALGGGGARGSYQIGVLKALEEAGILKQIHHISGSSIGAINTMLVMGKMSFERMVEIWEKIDNHQIYGSGLDRFKMDRMGLFSLQEMYEKLSKEVSLSEIRNSKIEGYVTAAKLKKGSLVEQVMLHRMEKEVFHLNNFIDPHKAVLASASIPVLFGSTEIEGSSYVDGGAVDNCPIQPLIDAGCDIIIAVPIDGWFSPKKYEKSDILLVNIEPHKLFHFIPFDILDFKPNAVQNKVDYGYKMGLGMMDKIKSLSLLDDHLNFHKENGFHLVEFTKDEEAHITREVV
jgi:NTE family protein